MDLEGVLLLVGIPCLFVAGLFGVGVLFDALLGPVQAPKSEPRQVLTTLLVCWKCGASRPWFELNAKTGACVDGCEAGRDAA